MPIAATIVKIVAREITVEEVPITSEEVILVNTSHRRTPERNPTIVSIKMYAAPLPTTFPFKPVTLHLILPAVYKCAILNNGAAYWNMVAHVSCLFIFKLNCKSVFESQ